MRAYLIPSVLIGGIGAFVVHQVLETRRSTATPGSSPGTVTQVALQSVESTPTRTIDVDSLGHGAGGVTVRASQRGAPTVDTASVRSLLQYRAPETYLRDILKEQQNALHRWPDLGRPIRVWIERYVTLPNWDPRYPIVAELAFREWQQAGFPLRFDFPLVQTDIDLHIRWVEKFRPEDGEMIGIAKKVRDQHGWLVSVEITIATHDQRGQPIPAEIVAGTARHEIGHALGLGHSREPTDVMFPESRTPAISAADRRTLNLLYLLPPGMMP